MQLTIELDDDLYALARDAAAWHKKSLDEVVARLLRDFVRATIAQAQIPDDPKLLVQAGVRLDAAPVSRRKSLASTSRSLALAYHKLPKRITWKQLQDLPVNPMRCPHLHVMQVRFGLFCVDCGICLERSKTESLLTYESLEQDFIVDPAARTDLVTKAHELLDEATTVARQYPEKVVVNELLRNARLVAKAGADQAQGFPVLDHVGDDSQESPT
jgi:ferredoxin